jgi:hypothetical protein
MAKVTIIISDKRKIGDVQISMESDPVWDVSGAETNTPAQMAGIEFLTWLKEKQAERNG